MTHRGSWSNKVGDPIYLIETTKQYGDREPMVAVKIFPSESGFKAGIRAVEGDIRDAKRLNAHSHLGWPEETVTYRTFILRDPQWEDYTP